MLIKTHLVITLFFSLLLVSYVNSPILFLVIALIATYIPDVDSKRSKIGNHFFLRPFQWIAKHRGLVHSFTFLLLVTFILALFLPLIALGFFLGYGCHLLADSFTIEGIKPLHPLRGVSSGNIITGGISETNIFIFFLIADIGLFFMKFSSIL